MPSAKHNALDPSVSHPYDPNLGTRISRDDGRPGPASPAIRVGFPYYEEVLISAEKEKRKGRRKPSGFKRRSFGLR